MLGIAALGIAAAAAQTDHPPQPQQGGGQTTVQGQQGYHGFGAEDSSRKLQKRTDLSNEAAEMLLDTSQARQALANGSPESALTQIDEALKSAQQVDSMASAQGLGAVVPIFAEYTQASVIAPIQAAGRRQQQQQQTGVEAAGVPGPAVRDVEAEFTAIGVDVPSMKQHLEAARKALLGNDIARAESALSAAESALVVVRVEGDLPLVKARQNLAIARGLVRQGRFQEARAPLKEAVNALGDYEGPRQAEAEQLQMQIASFSGSDFGGDSQMAANRIGQWWNQLADLTSSGTQRQQRQIG